MARSDKRSNGGRWRLAAGFSVVLGSIAVLLTLNGRRDGEAGQADDVPGPAGEAGLHVGRGRPATPPSLQAVKAGYEPNDAKAGSVGTVMAVAVAVIALCVAGLFGLLAIFHARDAARPPLTAQQRALLPPPGPPLQASPQYDLASLTALEEKRLDSYRWIDPAHTRAQIPIERAMALVVGKPLDPAP